MAFDMCMAQAQQGQEGGQVSGMDLFILKDCRASCDVWCPRAEHEDMGRTFQVSLFRERYPDIPSLDHTNSLSSSFVSGSFSDHGSHRGRRSEQPRNFTSPIFLRRWVLELTRRSSLAAYSGGPSSSERRKIFRLNARRVGHHGRGRTSEEGKSPFTRRYPGKSVRFSALMRLILRRVDKRGATSSLTGHRSSTTKTSTAEILDTV